MRKHGRLVSLILTLGAVATLSMAPTASAQQRWPVIGCYDLSNNYFNHYFQKWKPSGLCTITRTTAGIDHARWKHWGQKRATARGDFVDSLGYEYPARITAYDLRVFRNIGGVGIYIGYYAHLHVVAQRAFRGTTLRGPFDVTLNTTPDI